MNIFLVRTPLQFLNAITARRYFNIDEKDAILIILYNHSENTKKQLNYIEQTNTEGWRKTLRLKNRNNLFHLLELRYIIKKLTKENLNYKLFVGNYTNTIYRDIANNKVFEEVVLLDDGNATISLYDQMVNKNNIDLNKNKSILNRFIRRIVKLNPNYLSKCTFFTVYKELKPVQEINVIHHGYICFEKELINKKVSNDAVFLGSPYVDLQLMKEEDYLNLMRIIRKKFNNKIWYIPHRTETEEILKKIRNIGYTIKRLNTSIEYEILINRFEIPSHILCFTTSAAINFKYLLANKEVRIEVLKPEINKFTDDIYREKIVGIYKYYEKYVEVINENYLRKTILDNSHTNL